jgi:hypothetical protein
MVINANSSIVIHYEACCPSSMLQHLCYIFNCPRRSRMFHPRFLPFSPYVSLCSRKYSPDVPDSPCIRPYSCHLTEVNFVLYATISSLLTDTQVHQCVLLFIQFPEPMVDLRGHLTIASMSWDVLVSRVEVLWREVVRREVVNIARKELMSNARKE